MKSITYVMADVKWQLHCQDSKLFNSARKSLQGVSG
jgi:hypothetical protein